jgi:hypothetical protein
MLGIFPPAGLHEAVSFFAFQNIVVPVESSKLPLFRRERVHCKQARLTSSLTVYLVNFNIPLFPFPFATSIIRYRSRNITDLLLSSQLPPITLGTMAYQSQLQAILARLVAEGSSQGVLNPFQGKNFNQLPGATPSNTSAAFWGCSGSAEPNGYIVSNTALVYTIQLLRYLSTWEASILLKLCGKRP